MKCALQVTEGVLTMLPGSWQCALIYYAIVVFLCRKWKSFIASRARRGSFSCPSRCPCCSSGKCYQLLWLQSSCVHVQRGTTVRPHLAQEVPDLQRVGICGGFPGTDSCVLGPVFGSLGFISQPLCEADYQGWLFLWCEQVKPLLYSGFAG